MINFRLIMEMKALIGIGVVCTMVNIIAVHRARYVLVKVDKKSRNEAGVCYKKIYLNLTSVILN